MNEEKILKQLSELRKQLTTQTNNNILQKHGLTEQIVEFQKPVTDKLKENNKQVVNTLKAIRKTAPADANQLKATQIKSLSFKKPRGNNSYFAPKTDTGEFLIYDLNGVDKIKLNKETDELEIFKPDGSSEKTKNSEGINELLFREHIDFSKVTEKDVDDYFHTFILLQYNPGQSKRVKEIREKFPEVSSNYPVNSLKNLNVKRVKEYPGSGLSCKATCRKTGSPPSKSCCKAICRKTGSPPLESSSNEVPVDLTNKNPLQLFQELSLLLEAKQAGNKNTLGKASIILGHLKNNKSITKKKYDKMLSKFIN